MEESDVTAMRSRMKSMAHWYASLAPCYIEADDFEQEGWLAILERENKKSVTNPPAILVARWGMIALLRRVSPPGTHKHNGLQRPEKGSFDIVLESDLKQQQDLDTDDRMVDKVTVHLLVGELPEREREIIVRWANDLTLEEISQDTNYHLVHVARLKKKILDKLKSKANK